MKKYIILISLLAIFEISLALYLTIWREHFWNAVSNKASLDFIHQVSIFTVVALTACFVAGLSGYLVSLAAIKWREILNQKAFAIRELEIENINQRIQEDCMTYPDLLLGLLFGTLKAVVYVIAFSVALILSFEWWYLITLLGYTIAGSIITSYIAKPLIRLNYEQQSAEASYRNNLSISNFKDCVFIMLGLAKKQKHLTYFQQFYMQIAVVVPLLIIAPAYFTTAMTLGMLMRFNSVASTILDNMAYGITSFAIINRFLSCRKRLIEAGVI